MPLFRNNKNQKLYKILDQIVVNSTNGCEGQYMVLYKDQNGKKYVREHDEFYLKFTETSIEQFDNEWYNKH